ncbi:hypothetical protein [Streptomyces sp. NPDC059819]|uniref:hypothetical protein n=1 Tax=Streptomyces sp. NPDC059819 TaxID=3346963 RepID=UPI00364CCE9A
MTHIFHDNSPVEQGGVFEPMPDYKVIFVRTEPNRVILRDSSGEFSRPIRPASDRPRPARPLRLGERRTVLEEVPDARPIIDETIYLMTHQICVPGGWHDLFSAQYRGPLGQAGVYGPAGQMMEVGSLRERARRMFDAAEKKWAKHPCARLDALVTKVDLQEGAEGQPGSWDDPGVVTEIAQLLRSSNIL